MWLNQQTVNLSLRLLGFDSLHLHKQLNPNIMTENEKRDLKISLQLKDEEIARQIAKRKLAEQTRNWTIILVVVIHILIWVI